MEVSSTVQSNFTTLKKEFNKEKEEEKMRKHLKQKAIELKLRIHLVLAAERNESNQEG